MAADQQQHNIPIFVVGYMHSGTTLLHNILAAHADVFSAPDETRYFGYLPLIRTLYPDLSNDGVLADLIAMLVELITTGDPAKLRTAPQRYRPVSLTLTDAELAGILSKAQTYRDHGATFRIVFDALTQRNGKQRWIEKTPQHVFLIDEILQAVPEALFVEIKRDPRDILASKKKRKQTTRSADGLTPEERRVRSLERVYDPFWEALEWRFALRAGQQATQHYPDRVYSVRYENLVHDPDTVMQQLCDFVGLEFTLEMLQVRWWNTAEGNRQDRQGIVSDAIGRWKRSLGPGELALCQRIAGDQLTQAGYAAAPTSWKGHLTVPWLIVRAGFGLLDRLIRRWRLGGFGFLLNTLKNYAKELRKLIRSR
ncbi:MAG: sulfotransferase [Anaerolineae bacterium]|nr:sulfotransferase [Anaerolineae bacterium]